ncbi:endospore germination permease [Paenibacillus sp. PL2-23]|uniref:GerAB/ArcD/ProY family transporter n=1 Tax=Paenibacillus sp. PL2-23 TaxID=2100729 RepID=UPI0030F9717A
MQTSIQNKPITRFQFIVFIHLTQVGIGILTLPSVLHESAGTDGWISIIAGGLMSILLSILIILSVRSTNYNNFQELLINTFGSWIGKFVMLLWSGYACLAAMTVILQAVFIINTWILPHTPPYVILCLFTVPLYIIIRNSIQDLARYGEAVFFLCAWMPLISIPLVDKLQWIHLLPIAKEGWSPIIYAVQTTALSFLGFELIYFFYPNLEDKTKAISAVVIANLMSMLLFLFVALLCFMYFSPDEIESHLWPTLQLLKTIELPFIERFEIIFLSLYLFILSMTGLPYFYFFLQGLSSVFSITDHKRLLKWFITVMLLAGLFFHTTYEQVFHLSRWWNTAGIYYSFGFPILLFLLRLIWRRGHVE